MFSCLPRITWAFRSGTIRATVLIETILAAFEMHEILWELRDHSAGLNCGRWDYIFSFIKKFRNRPDFMLPNRAQVTMTAHFLASYVDLLIQTCHKRGIHAMGGMAAQIPIKNDPEANERALEKVRQDKLREVKAGHDGTWVAHPGLVRSGESRFRRVHAAAEPDRPQARRSACHCAGSAGHSRRAPSRKAACDSMSTWESSTSKPGCAATARVPIYNLMEDAATAEISRAQVWQWAKHGAKLEDGRPGDSGTGEADHRGGTGKDARPRRRRTLRKGQVPNGGGSVRKNDAVGRVQRLPDFAGLRVSGLTGPTAFYQLPISSRYLFAP